MSEIWLTDDLSDEIKQNKTFNEFTKNIAEDVIKEKLEISVLVERLSGVLTNTDPELRLRGMNIFSGILKLLPVEFLSPTQLTFISSFYIDRLKDNHRVVPEVLEGVLAIIKMKHFPPDCPSKILAAIFHNVPCQQQLRADRLNIYNIIYYLTVHHTEDLVPKCPDIVFGVVAAMDGERDPHCLVFLFSMLPALLSRLPLGHLKEEMFEVMACYFPVDFNSSPDDPNAITRKDLADKLAQCLCATPVLAEFCLPLLLEKLDSSLKIAKMDSLNLLRECCKTFKPSHFEVHIPTIWSCLQKEISRKSDEELLLAANDALQAFVNNLCSDPSSAMSSLSFLAQILLSMQCLLAEAKTKPAFELPLKTLLTVTRASDKSCSYIAENAIKLLISYYITTEETKLKCATLNWFCQLFQICKDFNAVDVVTKSFRPLPELCLLAVNNTIEDLRVSGYASIAVIADIFTPEEALKLCDTFEHVILNEPVGTISQSNKQCLLKMATIHPAAYDGFVTRKFVVDNSDNIMISERKLDVLSTLVSVDYFTEIAIQRILAFLQENFSNIDEATMTLTVFMRNIENENSNLFDEIKLQQIENNYNVLNTILQWADSNFPNLDEKLYDCVTRLIVIFVRAQTSEVQATILTKYLSYYIDKMHQANGYKNIIILEAILNSIKPDVKIENVNQIINSAIDLSLEIQDPFCCDKACFLIANVLNKYGRQNDFSAELDKVKSFSNQAPENRHKEVNFLRLCTWITKSLILNGHSESNYWLNKLASLLDNDTCGMKAAQGFDILMNEQPNVLTLKCYCIVNIFYRQRVFQQFVDWTYNPQSNFKLQTNKEAHLLAWGLVIKAVPKSVLQMESSKIIPILIESLNFQELDLLRATLSALSFLIQSKNPVIVGSLQTLLPRCLNLASFKNSMDVRIGSLQCLFDVANSYETVHLLPFKQDITMQLLANLDDPKRLVRNVAVKARTRWFLVGAPGEEK